MSFGGRCIPLQRGLPFRYEPHNLDLMAYQLPHQLHFLARHVEGQWFVECLDFSLGAQDTTLEAAQERLQAQVRSYVEEAVTLNGGAHAEQLLSRRAPWRDWLLFGLGMALNALHAARGQLSAYQFSFEPSLA